MCEDGTAAGADVVTGLEVERHVCFDSRDTPQLLPQVLLAVASVRFNLHAQTFPAFFLISASSRSPRSVAWNSSFMPVRVFLSASFELAYSIFGLMLALSSDLRARESNRYAANSGRVRESS